GRERQGQAEQAERFVAPRAGRDEQLPRAQREVLAFDRVQSVLAREAGDARFGEEARVAPLERAHERVEQRTVVDVGLVGEVVQAYHPRRAERLEEGGPLRKTGEARG